MFIRAYLRASSEDQFADREKNMLNDFVEERGGRIANYGLVANNKFAYFSLSAKRVF
nr:hypothetical protein [Providencia sp.]UNJ80132.1 hypothetical protein [Providencia sp.]